MALTHNTSVLKENKDPGKWGYLVAMQAVEPSGLTRDYSEVVVEPRKGGSEVKFITAFTLDSQQWINAMKKKGVRMNPGSK